ncbi:MAG: hypothetical protein AAF493_11245 [Pseudomonadota bacterium]
MSDGDIVVHFIHGLEGSPNGRKARLLGAHFDCETPAMDTGDFEGCIALHHQRLAIRPPGIVVGSSYGGAVAVALLQRGHWRGPTLLLAQAAMRRGLLCALPERVPIWIAHGDGDDVVSPADSQRLAALGDPGWVRLIEVEDDHALHTSTDNGALLAWVRGLAALATP